ncbi:DUF1320 domain-containing protein [Candidatus Sumerlaeota bacterium]|nr:DUF1320 domain-containing protein [Candidatus Sumerlaeota bacterium]
MSYSSQAELEKRIGAARLARLADLDGDGSADADVLTAALERADGVIDLHLRGRYTVPFETAPAAVKELASDLALYYLHQARRETMSARDRQAYEDAMAMLKGLAEGRGGLDVGGADEDVSEVGLPEITTPLSEHDPVFRDDEDGASNLDNY